MREYEPAPLDSRRHQCNRKRRYATDDEARRAARRMESKTGDAFNHYPCVEYCGGYHVGRKMIKRTG